MNGVAALGFADFIACESQLACELGHSKEMITQFSGEFTPISRPLPAQPHAVFTAPAEDDRLGSKLREANMRSWLWKGMLGAAVALPAPMRNVFKAGMLASMTAAATFWVAPPAVAQGVSQIVLSCSSTAPKDANPNPCSNFTAGVITRGSTAFFFGAFWIWCQSPTGGTPYGPDCNGAVYVEEVAPFPPTANTTAKYEPTSVSGNSSPGGPTGLKVTFTTSDGDLSCALYVPTSPTSGPTNTVSGLCNGVTSITFSNVVVQVT